jgi:GNAT superfamily N-acetyltransferase
MTPAPGGTFLHTLSGPDLDPWLEPLGQLRIQVFREFPYLYEGSAAYEREYLRSYRDSPQARVFLLTDAAGNAVGASTCTPLAEADFAFQQPFLQAGLKPADFLYLGESVLLPAWRGRGLGRAFFEWREAHAASLKLPNTTFCAVERPPNHPQRPALYRALDPFWSSLGYTRQNHLQARLSWLEIGQKAECENTLTFWLRHLSPARPC